jgi:mannose-6-phosphate isomerase-like protein (cupin superfamily)
VKSGTCIVEYGKIQKKIRIKDDMSVIILPNVLHFTFYILHFIKNTGNKPLKLYTIYIYSPSEHIRNKIDKRMPI